MKRYLPPALLAIVIVLSAPYMGVIRDVLFDRFESATIRYLVRFLILLAAATFLYALARIREHRGWRYAGLIATAGLLWIESAYLSAPISSGGIAARVSVAEKIHLVEYGLLALLLYLAFKPARDLSMLILPLLWVTFAGVLDESMQWWVETRTGEVGDVWLNIYAGFCGLLFSLALDPPERMRWRLSPASRRHVIGSAILAIAGLGLLFDTAHLGYEHHDPAIGSFRSWHTLDELQAAALDRAVRWRVDPPTDPSPWKAEDRYLAEAGWHAGHRNERYDAGDLYLAAQANRILETYFGPYLDLEFFRASGKQRYPPEIRRELEAKAPTRDPAKYLSPVLTHRIYPWPSKRQFYAALAAVLLLIWAVPRLLWRKGQTP